MFVSMLFCYLVKFPKKVANDHKTLVSIFWFQSAIDCFNFCFEWSMFSWFHKRKRFQWKLVTLIWGAKPFLPCLQSTHDSTWNIFIHNNKTRCFLIQKYCVSHETEHLLESCCYCCCYAFYFSSLRRFFPLIPSSRWWFS